MMPTLSVSLLGLVVAALLVVLVPDTPVHTLLSGVVGAWLGFGIGAVGGVIVDVATGSDVFVALAGHAAAVVGAAAIGSRGLRPAGLNRTVES